MDPVQGQGHGGDPAGSAGLGGECGGRPHVEPAGADDGGADLDGAAEVAEPVPGHAEEPSRAGEPGGRGHGACPAGGAAARGDLVEDPGADGDGPHAVGEGVVELDEDGEGTVGGAAEQVHLPGRQTAGDGSFHELGGEPGGLGGEVGAGEGDLVDMAEHVEVRVGAPGGAADGEQDVADTHPEPGDGGGAAGEQGEDVGRLVAALRGRGAEVGERPEVQRVRGGFQVPEGQVKRCQ